ncbi:MAG: hypothetical protein WB729_14650 [Candidatus Sulfotelmatobacter sp.]
MISPLISLVLLFGHNGKTMAAPSPSLNSDANRHVAPAENPQPQAWEVADTDGKGHPTKPPGQQPKPPMAS